MSSTPHNAPDLGPAELVEVADRVFAYIQPDGSWWINNTGFVVGRKSVVSIDACSTHKRTAAYLDRIGHVTDKPVTTLINTHHHGDHTNGNSLFTDATIVAHEKTRTALLAFGAAPPESIWDPVEWGPIELAPPTLTFADRVRVWSDDLPLEVSFVGGPAHTDNDSLIWLPEQRVLYCGDLLCNGGTPFLLMGSVTGAIQVLTEVVAPFPAETIVPGHGSPCTPALIDTVVATCGSCSTRPPGDVQPARPRSSSPAKPSSATTPLARRRAAGRQPAPGLRRSRSGQRPAGRVRRPTGHGRLQRWATAVLLRLIARHELILVAYDETHLR